MGIVLSGGPDSILDKNAPTRPLRELLEIAPLMGICYGLQLICHQWGGKLSATGKRTYGKSVIHWKFGNFPRELKVLEDDLQKLFQRKKGGGGRKFSIQKKGTKKATQQVWMSHGDFVSKVPRSFSVLAETERNVPAVLLYKENSGLHSLRASKKESKIKSNSLREVKKRSAKKSGKAILALQFHPEVAHTKYGREIISYFAKDVCSAKKRSWTDKSMLHFLESQIKKDLNSSDKVLCALSGGVDSTVTACLLTRLIGRSHVHCVFLDTGLLRENEFKEVLDFYKQLKLNVKGLSVKKDFLNALKKVKDPEKKRKIIGRVFIDIFKNYQKKYPYLNCLAQGTLYPDVIESVSYKGPSVTIKSHHNVGGLPKKISFKLVEPLRYLFKDEVRRLAKTLKIPNQFVFRHPFPGPGLAVRCCGEVTEDRLRKLRKADLIYIEEIKQANLYHQIWQAFCVLLPVKSVGVQGDRRTYDEVIVLRAVTATDGMTADWFSFPDKLLHKISDRITNEVEGINRVVYDITSKPPGTIEWL